MIAERIEAAAHLRHRQRVVRAGHLGELRPQPSVFFIPERHRPAALLSVCRLQLDSLLSPGPAALPLDGPFVVARSLALLESDSSQLSSAGAEAGGLRTRAENGRK